MKIFALSFVLLLGSAYASVPELIAKKHTCEELKTQLQNYQSLVIVKKFLFFKKRVAVQLNANCSEDESTMTPRFKTKDKKDCYVGQWCKSYPTIYVSSSYSSGSSYSSPSYGGSSWSSGSSYDSGSSWSSGSSSSSSSSSSSHGSHYDPPSSGERGPRYCPTCSL